MSVLLEFSMVPMDKGDSFSEYVARSIRTEPFWRLIIVWEHHLQKSPLVR